MAFDSTRYKREFAKENYDRLSFTVPKGKREVVKQYANERGMSISQLVVLALETLYHLDLSK